MPLKYGDDGMEIREQHYQKYLGKMDDRILHSTNVNEKPHIDIYQIPPTPQRPAWTLITGGMSDAKQNVPQYYKRFSSGRTELLMYAREPQDWMLGLLRKLSLMPFAHKNFLHWEHLCCLGDSMITKKTDIAGVVFMPPSFEKERFCNTLYINGDKVDPLWVIPITRPELELCQQDNGVRRVVESFMLIGHPRIFDTV